MLKRILAVLIAALAVFMLAACSDGSEDTASSDITEINTYAGGILDTSEIFSLDDLIQSVDTSNARTYTLKSGSDIAVTKAGTYVITGSADDVQIAVKVNTGETVRLILDGASIENEDRPCINVISGDRVIVTTAEGTDNHLAVTDSFADSDYGYDAVIFSREDLTINGHGTLTVESPENGITCKDDLKVTGGTLNVTSAADALEAKDSVSVADGDIVITSAKDGIHSEDSDSDDKGYFYMCGGSLDIEAEDDAIHAVTVVQIDGGTVNAEGSEGIEGTYVQINGGDISLTCADDGINAARKSDSYTATAEINGGTLTITMGSGDTDGIDSNGNLYINGGTVDITGQNAFDYTGEGRLSGGTVTVNGEEVTELENQFMGMADGNMPGMTEDGEMPEPPSDGERPELPEPPADGERPEMPDSGDMPEPPSDGERPGMPGEDTQADPVSEYIPLIICAGIAVAAVAVLAAVMKRKNRYKKGDR